MPVKNFNQYYFITLQEAKKIVEDWWVSYNTFRPHGSLNGLTPEEFIKAGKEQENSPETQLTSCAM